MSIQPQHWLRRVPGFKELGVFGKMQRGMLFGGAAVLSLAVFVVAGIGVYVKVSNYIADGREIFITHKALLLIDIETKQAALQRGVINAEFLWGEHRPARAALLRDFKLQGGRAYLHASPRLEPQLALGDVEAKAPEAYSNYLAFSEEQAFTASASARQRGQLLTGYYYSPDEKFVSIMPPPRTGDPMQALKAHSLAELIHALAKDIGDLNDPEVDRKLLASRKVMWIPPHVDPFTGDNVFKLVQPAFDGDKPFIVFVSDLPVQALSERLAQAPYDGNMLLLSKSGDVLLEGFGSQETSPERAHALTMKVVQDGMWKRGLTQTDSSYHDGVFTISEPLSETGWALVYTYSWHTILSALQDSLWAYAAAVLTMLVLIWTFVLLFHYRVFRPAYLQSLRVYESENLSRTIIGTAPVGLSLVAFGSGDLLLQNSLGAVYTSLSTGTGLISVTTAGTAEFQNVQTSDGDIQIFSESAAIFVDNVKAGSSGNVLRINSETLAELNSDSAADLTADRIILLTNRVNPTRTNKQIAEARIAIHTAILSAIDASAQRSAGGQTRPR